MAAAEEGARVAAAARRTDRLEALSSEIGGGAAVRLDVQDAEACREGVEAAVQALGGLDAVVYVVGTATLGGIAEEGRYPANRHIAISEQPVFNRAILNWVIFEGEITDHLMIELTGEELDRFSANE